jgi:hypothetical protein
MQVIMTSHENLYRRFNGRPSGGGAWSSPALRGMVLGCGKTKLEGLRSTSGSQWSSGCTGSGFGGGVGGYRRWLGMAAEVG